MRYDPERRVAVLSNGREYVPQVHAVGHGKGGTNEPCGREWWCARQWQHAGPCRWNRVGDGTYPQPEENNK